MELRPIDLGGTRAVAIIQERLIAYQSMNGVEHSGQTPRRPGDSGKRRLGLIDRFIRQGSGMDDETAMRVQQAIAPMTNGMIAGFAATTVGMAIPMALFLSHGQFVGAALLGMIGVSLGGFFLLLPVAMGRQWISRPLSDTELNQLITNAHSPIERALGSLLQEVARQDIPEESQEALREAIRCLSEAIDRLPPLATAGSADVAVLQQNAAAVRARSDAESDPVTQASLSRQADALERSAAAAERSAVSIRRTTALHQELAAQIEALRLGLSTFYAGDADTRGLSTLSENVRVVAAEATSLADARAELDAPRLALRQRAG